MTKAHGSYLPTFMWGPTMNSWVAYLLGVATLPAAWALLSTMLWAFQRNVGYGPCEFCTHLGGDHGYDIGQRYNFMHAIDSWAHARIWARTKRHRLARGNAWRERDATNRNHNTWYPKYML
jgi:hypothetical protein